MQKISPYLWFDGQAEAAMALYISIFPGSKVVSTTPGPDGKIMMCVFELFGQRFLALNGGPHFTFTEALSLYVDCETQEEADRYWDKLAEGGTIQQCGWLKDRFGVSWQIIPALLPKLMSDPDPVKAGRVAQAMMQMQRIDSAALQRAYDGN